VTSTIAGREHRIAFPDPRAHRSRHSMIPTSASQVNPVERILMGPGPSSVPHGMHSLEAAGVISRE